MTPKKRKPEQPDAQIVQGHVLNVLAGMEAESVSCCVTSPPYWSQRKYEAPDVTWPDGWRGQLGLEPTVEMYVEHTLTWLKAVHRVLRPDGVCWVNLGDGYASNPAKGGSGVGGKEETWHGGVYDRRSRGGLGTLKEKDLVLMPFSVALAAQAAGWWVRQVVIWNKPNCMPESCKDRPTTAHEYVLMLTKSARYWYDQDAVRERRVEPDRLTDGFRTGGAYVEQAGPQDNASRNVDYEPAPSDIGSGRNLRSVWTFPTAQTPEAHFATFPEELPKRCILASCPPDGTVLDPFAGVGTTGVVARRLGRRFVGIELSEKYCRMAAKRMEQTTLGIPL